MTGIPHSLGESAGMSLETPTGTLTGTEQAIDQVARNSYGRLIAFLSVRSHDIAAAEDALSEAFQGALRAWPRAGVPDNPEAWLLTTARRRLIDAGRHSQVETDALPTLLASADEAQRYHTSRSANGAGLPVEFPDERLQLLFLCAHPAIDSAMHTPLMLQTVLGLDAVRIASAFLVKPTAMGQRLSRAKSKIRDARLRFDLPEPKQLPERTEAVLEAIYAAYGSGWEDVAGADARRRGLAEEAIELARLMIHLLPEEPEAKGLLALMLYCESRREARRAADGAYVPLSEQDPSLWSGGLIAEAERCLASAAAAGRMGRFQLEAAIQSVHAQRARTGMTDWEAIAVLYEGLVAVAPTIGALIGRAASVAEARDAATGWLLLRSIPDEAVVAYQPYWALSAHLLQRLDRVEEASAALTRAMGLCEDAAMRAFLARHVGEGLEGEVPPSGLR